MRSPVARLKGRQRGRELLLDAPLGRRQRGGSLPCRVSVGDARRAAKETVFSTAPSWRYSSSFVVGIVVDIVDIVDSYSGTSLSLVETLSSYLAIV